MLTRPERGAISCTNRTHGDGVICTQAGDIELILRFTNDHAGLVLQYALIYAGPVHEPPMIDARL